MSFFELRSGEPLDKAGHYPASRVATIADREIHNIAGMPATGVGFADLAPRLKLAGRLALVMAIVDLLAIVTAFGLATIVADMLRGAMGVDNVSPMNFLEARGRELALLSTLTIGVFAFGGLYRRTGWELDEIRKIVAGVGLVALFDAVLQFALRDHESRLWFFTAYPMVVLTVISYRMILRSLPSMADAMTSHIVLLGNGISADELIYEMRESRSGPSSCCTACPFR